MVRILVTGMSGTGKSTALVELGRRGHAVIDADLREWSVEVPDPGGSGQMQLWREDAIGALLETHQAGWLFIAGCVSNQGRFYDRFDAVVLLRAPPDVMLQRIAERASNAFGKSDDDRQRILADLEQVEPLLRATSTTEIEATIPAEAVADMLEAVARQVDGIPR
jgi:dephospho-CoA kinase